MTTKRSTPAYRQMLDIITDEMIKIVDDEAKTGVYLTDNAITEVLRDKGLPVANSLIVKIRKQYGIPTAKERRLQALLKDWKKRQ